MKKLIYLIALLAFPLKSFCLPIDTVKEDRVRRHANVSRSAQHGKMVWFTNQYFNVDEDFQEFLLFDMNLNLDESQEKYFPDGGRTFVYRKTFVGNPSQRPKPITYTINANTDKETIKSVVIKGAWSDIVQLYVEYWSKPININKSYPVGKEIAWVYFFGDKASIYYESNGIGKILITPNNQLTVKKYYVYPTEDYFNLPVNNLPKTND